MPNPRNETRRRIVILFLIFLTAISVRLLILRNQRAEALQVQTRVTQNYKHLASLLLENGFHSFFDASSTTSNPDLLGHPPGYSILLALIYRFAGESDLAALVFQIVCNSLCAVIIFLIAIELLPLGVGAIAGFLAAFAPQFSWNSILLLPDTLAALPILIAIYLITRSRKQHPWLLVFGAGACLGLSCWLRANALLLTPFVVMAMPFIFQRGRRLKLAITMVIGTILVLAPLTIRNAVVFGHFIPVSLGGGQTLLEGIGDYDQAGQLGVPSTDMDLIRQEAEMHQRPDYATTLFGPDAIQRDRERTARGLAIVRAHPLWFLTVMVRRAADMWRLERAPLISPGNVGSGWTRYAALVLFAIQRLFVTAVFLPLVLIGLSLLVIKKQHQALAILMVVPVYYFCVQSVLHTEYRYVLTIHYFFFVLAAVAIYFIACRVGQLFRRS